MIDAGLDLFRAACGVRGPICVTRPEGGAVVSVRDPGLPFAVVGRTPEADLVLGDAAVSRRHAYMQVIEGRAFWMDMGGRGGVAWPAGRAKSGWADGCDGVRVGPFRVVAQATPGDGPRRRWSPTATATPQSAAWPALRIDLVDDLPGAPPGPRPIGRVLALVGRSAACHVRLVDPAVSSYQAALVRTPQGPWVVDLLGRGGTSVNGVAVRFAPLRDGDELRFGPYRLRALCEPRPGTGLAVAGPAPRATVPELCPPRGEAGPPSPLGPADLRGVECLIGDLGAIQAELLGQFRGALYSLLRSKDAASRDEIAALRSEVAELRRLALEPPAPRPSPSLRAPTPAPAPPPPPPPPPAADAAQVQDWLTRRFEAIREDQPGRLRRVFGTVIRTRRRGPAGDIG